MKSHVETVAQSEQQQKKKKKKKTVTSYRAL
jgi:hypothetical protein